MSIGRFVQDYSGPGDDMRLRIRDLEIADYLLCDQSLYSKYERGERPLPLELAVRLAQFYGTSVDYLVGLTRNKTPYR